MKGRKGRVPAPKNGKGSKKSGTHVETPKKGKGVGKSSETRKEMSSKQQQQDDTPPKPKKERGRTKQQVPREDEVR